MKKIKGFFLGLSTIKKIVTIVIVLGIAWGGYRFFFGSSAPAYDTVTATRGTIVQEVSVTGNTAPVHGLDLAFENGGTISAVNFDVGAHVNAGDVIARTNTSDLEAQLAQAQANVDAQTAKLKSLQAGSRPEDIQASQAAVAKAQQDLTNMYGNISNTLSDGYTKANDAVRNQISSFFSGAETSNPHLTFMSSDSQVVNDVQTKRIMASAELDAWQNELFAISAASPTSTLESALQKGVTHLGVVQSLLLSASQALILQVGLSDATVNMYKSAITAAQSEVNIATTNINGAVQDIASQKIAIEQLQAQLALKLAGSTPEDIQAQQAQVEQAQASAQSIQAKLSKAVLVAPVAGTITAQNAKVGQIASPGAVMASLISDAGLEVDANITEADIGKLKIGDPATMTLDAFQGRTFTGKISYIDPGETVIEGVPTYKTTFQFDSLGPDVKPGMTANIDIIADKHDNAVIVPQRSVANNNGVRTVSVFRGAGQPPEERTVTVGLRDVNGNIEIVSGLNEGEVILRTPAGQ